MTVEQREKLLLGSGYLRGLSGSTRSLDKYDRQMLKELSELIGIAIGVDVTDPEPTREGS